MLAWLPALSIAIASRSPTSSVERTPVVAPAPEPPPPPKPAVALPPRDQLPSVADDVVVRALDRGRSAFSGCFARARRRDPTLRATKVELHVFLASDGAVLGVETDVADPSFAACLVGVAKRLPFPAPGRTAVANIAFVAS
jgi:hypothetical protein